MILYGRLAHLIAALCAGDQDSALAYWRSREWSAADRARAERLLRTATDVRMEVLP